MISFAICIIFIKFCGCKDQMYGLLDACMHAWSKGWWTMHRVKGIPLHSSPIFRPPPEQICCTQSHRPYATYTSAPSQQYPTEGTPQSEKVRSTLIWNYTNNRFRNNHVQIRRYKLELTDRTISDWIKTIVHIITFFFHNISPMVRDIKR